jgi:urocanate hydratase
MCFDYGGPFRCLFSGKPDLQKTDTIACQVLEEMAKNSTEIQQQMQDNIQWIKVRRKIN